MSIKAYNFKQRGYTLMEMAIVLIVISIGVTSAIQFYQIKQKANLAKSIADEIIMVDGALASFGTNNYGDIQAHRPVLGVNDPLNPTLAELAALNYLPAAFVAAGHNILGNHYVLNIALINSPPGQPIASRSTWLPNLALPAMYTADSAITPKNLALAYIVYTDTTYDDTSLFDKVIMEAAKVEAVGKNVAYSDKNNPNKLIGLNNATNWKNPTNLGGILMMATGFGMDAPNFLQQVGDRRDLTLNNGLVTAGTSYFQGVDQAGALINAGQIVSQNNVTANSFFMIGRASSDLCGQIGQMTTDVYGNLVSCTGVNTAAPWVPNIYGVATAASGTGVVAGNSPYLTGLLAWNNATDTGVCIPTTITITTSRDIVLPPSCQTVEVMLRGAGGGGATPYVVNNGATDFYYSATIPAQPGALVGGLAWQFQNSPGKLFHVKIASDFTLPDRAGANSYISDNTGAIILTAQGGAAGGVTNIGLTPVAGAAGITPVQNAVFGGTGVTSSGAGGIISNGNATLATGQTPHPQNIGAPDPITGNDLAFANYGGSGGGGGWIPGGGNNAPLAGGGAWQGSFFGGPPPGWYPPNPGILYGYNAANNIWIAGSAGTYYYYYAVSWNTFGIQSPAMGFTLDYCWDANGTPITSPVTDQFGTICTGANPPNNGVGTFAPGSGGYGAPGVLVLKISQ